MKESVKPVENFEGFDYKDIEKIEDPTARSYAEKAYKSFQRGFNSKFQELSEIRKKLEDTGATKWTPERIQALINNPEFVASAESLRQIHNQTEGQMTNEEWSALSETERKQFSEMRNQVKMLANQNTKMLQKQQDEKLQGKYADYNPSIVDDMTQQLVTGNYQATREDIFKVINYENAVKKAYELGKQDRQLDIGQRVQSVSTDGVAVTQTQDVPNKNEGESNFNYFKRLAQRRLAQSKSGQINRS